MQTIGQPLFERWTTLMGEPHWLEDPRFKDDMSRGDHGEVISERMATWCTERTTEAALSALEEARIPAGPVYSPQRTLDDTHVQAVRFLKAVPFPSSSKTGADRRHPVLAVRDPDRDPSPRPVAR